MSLDNTTDLAYYTAARFGLGPKPDELPTIANDPRGWLLDQLKNPTIPQSVYPTADEAADSLLLGKAAKQAGIKPFKIYAAQTARRFANHVATDQPFYERQVMFWSNHFTVSVQRAQVAMLVNAFEAQAIRPNVGKTFKDMLLAVAQHPAMLLYLDNAQSIGPDSRAGQRRHKNINENLGREMMELHTLGVGGGYTQADVISLARILTGWSLDHENGHPVARFTFNNNIHEPGPKILLGRTFDEGGMADGIAAMTMLATHPSTAKFIATKLVRHYVADEPPPDLVAQVADTFMNTGGHIPSLMETLINSDETWQHPLAKFKDSYNYCVATFRALGFTPRRNQGLASLHALGYRVFNAPSPAGYSDLAADWAAPDAVMKRINWSNMLAQRFQRYVDPRELAENIIGTSLSPATEQAIAQAPSGVDGLSLLLVSPEFQRR